MSGNSGGGRPHGKFRGDQHSNGGWGRDKLPCGTLSPGDSKEAAGFMQRTEQTGGGDIVCDCNGKHTIVKAVSLRNAQSNSGGQIPHIVAVPVGVSNRFGAGRSVLSVFLCGYCKR